MKLPVDVAVHAQCRIRIENHIFAGLWHGCSKPDMALFLKPLVKSLQSACSSGMLHPCMTIYNMFELYRDYHHTIWM